MVQAPKTEPWKQLYRALLRSSGAAVRFSRPATSNTRRYLRDEFAATAATAATSLQQPAAWDLLGKKTRNTLAFHLSSSLLPSGAAAPRTRLSFHNDIAAPDGSAEETKRPAASKANRLARLPHRVVANLSSLTYHHLSPHTQMQTGKRFGERGATRKTTKLSSLARVLGRLDNTSPLDGDLDGGDGIDLRDALTELDGDAMVNQSHMRVGFLTPSNKPPRGPLQAKRKIWDGQDADKIESEGQLRQMEADLKRIERLLKDQGAIVAPRKQESKDPSPPKKRERLGKKAPKKDDPEALMAKQVQEFKQEAEVLKKKIKTVTKALAKAEAQDKMENIPVALLADLVAAAQDSEQLLLGKQRWTKRKHGAFLPP